MFMVPIYSHFIPSQLVATLTASRRSVAQGRGTPLSLSENSSFLFPEEKKMLPFLGFQHR